mgnify:CR=1 FL=1
MAAFHIMEDGISVIHGVNIYREVPAKINQEPT